MSGNDRPYWGPIAAQLAVTMRYFPRFAQVFPLGGAPVTFLIFSPQASANESPFAPPPRAA